MPDQKDIEAGKTNAILAYCTLIGWIIAIVLNGTTKSKFASFHIRQGLGLMCTGVLLAFLYVMILFIIPMLFWFVPLLNLGLLALLILGIVNAAGGKMEGIPVLGDLFNSMFAGIK
jgi:uncharacterized membrane protein